MNHSPSPVTPGIGARSKVVVIDDSALVRHLLTEIISRERDLQPTRRALELGAVDFIAKRMIPDRVGGSRGAPVPTDFGAQGL